jgi:hypothetical protein
VTNRDDIVMRPRLEGSQMVTNAMGRTPEARQLQLLEHGHRSLRNRVLAARAARRIYQNRRRAAAARRMAQLGARAGRGLGAAGRGVAKAATRTPWGVIAAAVAAAGVVLTKAITGRSFEQLGIDAKRKLIGDLDLEAASASDARRAVTGNNLLMRELAATHDASGARGVYNLVRNNRLTFLRGQQTLQSAIAAPGDFDQFVDGRFARVKKLIARAFGEDSQVVDAARRFARAWRSSYQSNWQGSNR